MEIEDIMLDTYRNALLRISSGMATCLDGTISLDRQDMQAIARKAIDDVAGMEIDAASFNMAMTVNKEENL